MNPLRIIALVLITAAVSGCSTNSANVRLRGSLLDIDLRTPDQLNASKPASAQVNAQAVDPGIIAGLVQGFLGIRGRIKLFSIEADVGEHLGAAPGYGGPDPDMPQYPTNRNPGNGGGGVPVDPMPSNPDGDWVPPADDVESASVRPSSVSEFKAATTPWWNRQPTVRVSEVKGLRNGGSEFSVQVTPGQPETK